MKIFDNMKQNRDRNRLIVALQFVALGLIRLYQLLLSPWLGRQCRFYPSCSRYAAEAIETHGVFQGSRLAIARLSKCHPFHPGGVDLVPDLVVPDIGVPDLNTTRVTHESGAHH